MNIFYIHYSILQVVKRKIESEARQIAVKSHPSVSTQSN